MVFFHYRAADTAADARRHLDKTAVNFSAFDVAQRRHAVFDTVQRHVSIVGILLRERLEDAAGRREKTRAAFFVGPDLGGERHPGRLEPGRQLVKRQHGIDDPLVIMRLVQLGHTRTDEHGLGPGNALFNILAVRLHRRQYVGQIRQFSRKILLNQKIDGVTTRRDDDVAVFLIHDALVFILDDRRPDGGFLDVIKSQLFERLAHRLDPDALVIGNERRRQTDDDRGAALQKHLHVFGLIDDLFRILRTDHKTRPATDALVSNDMRLVPRKSNRFDRTMANTFITILTIRPF